MDLFELVHITTNDIIGLDQLSSLKFFEFLFRKVFNKYSLPTESLTLPSDPNIADQGIDAFISEDIPDNCDILPQGTSIFQFKASTSVFNLKRNFLQSKSEELKPLLKELLEQGATYILINTKKKLTISQKRGEEKRILEFIKDHSDLETIEVKVYSADDVARWADKYIELRLKFNKIRDAKDFELWKMYINKELKTDYLFTDSLRSLSFELLNYIRTEDPDLKYFQVKGPPGVGKRTFIANTLDLLDKFTKQNIIVINSLEEEILDTLTIIIHSGIKNGILVVEGVNSNIFEKIYSKMEWVHENNLKVVTIYRNYIYTQKKYEKTKLIDIKPLDDENAEKIILKIDSSIPFIIKKHILDLSVGIPGLIIQLTSLLKDEKFDIYEEISIESFCESILDLLASESGYEKPILIQTLVGFSLFSELGWETANYKELTPNGWVRQFQGNKEHFFELIGISHERYKVDILIDYLLKKGILSMRGRYILVNIRPLANYIVEKYVQEKNLINYLIKIWELSDSHFLAKFLERMKDLAFTFGNKIVRPILESDFISHWKDFQDPTTYMREDKLSKSGIFLELTRLDHKLVIEKLKEIFKDVDSIQLQQDLTNRRNLIYALEHIVWYEETFREGMNLLLKLALGENEQYANNATGVFKDKFSIYLPGTSVSLNKRMEYLTNLKNIEEPLISGIILGIISQIFNLRQRFRIISAEIQSIKPIPEEYNKFTNKEYFDYLSSAFSLLKAHINSSKGSISEDSYEIFFEIIPTLIGSHLWDDIPLLLKNYGRISTDNRVKLINLISSIKRREEKFEIPSRVDEFYKIVLEPTSIKSPSQFTKELLETIRKEQNKPEFKSLNEKESEARLRSIIKENIERGRHFDDWDKLYSEFEADLSIIDKIKITLNDQELFLVDRSGMNFDEFHKHKAKKLASMITENQDEFWDVIRFLVNRNELIITYIGWVLGDEDPSYLNWDGIKKIFLEEKETRDISFVIGYFTDLRMNKPDEWIAKLEELKNEEGLSRDLFLLGIATAKLDNWVINLTNELIGKDILKKSDLMKLIHKIMELDEKSYVKLARIFFQFFENPLEGFRSGRFDPEEYSDPLLFFHRYLFENKNVIPQLEDLLLEVLTSFEQMDGKSKTLSRY